MEAPPDQGQVRPDQPEESVGGLGVQVRMMVRAFMASPERNRLLFLTVVVFLIILATAYGQVQLNAWNQPFYNSLADRNLPEFLRQLVNFLIIAGLLLVLNVTQMWLNLMIKLKLRQGLVQDLLAEWMKPRRAFRLANAGSIGVNPDQRLHEDARHLTELSTDLGVGLLQSSILLVSFVGVLWNISSGFSFQFGPRSLSIPGYMVWAAVFYAATASLVSLWVGRPLVGYNANRYAREAEFRFSLVRASEHADAISLNGGEKDEERHLNLDLQGVLGAMRKLVTAMTHLQWVTSGYGWFTIVAPILVAAPVYFAGNLSFGGMMVAVGAFNQVQGALRWFVDNFNTIADWRATLLRVANFRHAMVRLDALEKVGNQIAFADASPGRLVLENIEINAPTGLLRLEESDVAIVTGERVLVVGETGADKALFFRAIAGLWPWGSGKVALPPGESVTFMPRRPYFPPGTLRETLAYPRNPSEFADGDFTNALQQLRLDHLVPSLDRKARWDKELEDDEQQCLAFARLPLHKPAWILIDEALETLDDDARRRIIDLFGDQLVGSTIIHIGRPEAQNKIFTRVLHLTREPGGEAPPDPFYGLIFEGHGI